MALVVRRQQVDFRNVTLDRLTERLKESAAWLKDYLTAIKHGQFHPFTPMERKAREATRNEPWGPTGTMLNDLAEQSFDATSCDIIFAVLTLRMGYPADKWRNVYKALTVLEFLLKRGSDRCVSIARDEMMYRLEDLEKFQYTASDGKDQGINVRHRAQAIRLLLNDAQQLQQERETFKAKQKQYQGFSREQLSSYGSFNKSSDGLRRSRSFDADILPHPRTSITQSQEAPADVPSLSRGKNAGEMKGVTLEENKKNVEALQLLLQRPENRTCADCTGGGAGSRPSWASINTGVFICMRCAGIHRGLGVHISKVRSVTLDTWLPGQVSFMEQTGNGVANAFWEAKLDASHKPHHDSPELQAFVRRKYNREFAEGVWPPSELAGIQQQEQAASVRRSASGREVRAASGMPAAEALWQSPLPSQAATADGFGFSTFGQSPGEIDTSPSSSEQTPPVTGGRRPLRPGTKLVVRGPTVAVPQSQPASTPLVAEAGPMFDTPQSSTQAAAQPTAPVPSHSSPVTVAHPTQGQRPAKPRITMGLPTGFEELLASVGVSLLDEDYGASIPSTPYQQAIPVDRFPSAPDPVAVQPTVGQGGVQAGIYPPRPVVDPNAAAAAAAREEALGAQASWLGRSASLQSVSSVAFEEDAAWSVHSGSLRSFAAPTQMEGPPSWSVRSGGPPVPITSADSFASRDAGALPNALEPTVVGLGVMGPPTPSATGQWARGYMGPAILPAQATPQRFAPSGLGLSPYSSGPIPPSALAGFGNDASSPAPAWVSAPVAPQEPAGIGPLTHSPYSFGTGVVAGERNGMQLALVPNCLGAMPVTLSSGDGRKPASFPPMNEQEARAAREKEVLGEMFASALEDLRLEIPATAKQRMVSLKEQRAA